MAKAMAMAWWSGSWSDPVHAKAAAPFARLNSLIDSPEQRPERPHDGPGDELCERQGQHDEQDDLRDAQDGLERMQVAVDVRHVEMRAVDVRQVQVSFHAAGCDSEFQLLTPLYLYAGSAYACAARSADDFFYRAAVRHWQNQFAVPPV
jgi:hypothetical protein